MKYVDASAVLRVLFCEPGPEVPLITGDRVVSSQVVEVEAFRAVDRERLFANLDHVQTAAKRKELGDLLAMLDLAPIDGTVNPAREELLCRECARARCNPCRHRRGSRRRGAGIATRTLDT